MGKVEEKVVCQYCGKELSKAGIANHEKACPKNPKNIINEEETDAVVTETAVTEEAPAVQVITEPITKEKLVEVKIKDSIECYIGDRYYRLKKGEVVEVSEEVKDRLKSADLLDAL